VPPIIHRDVNPNNILRLPSGAWFLADVGLAKFLQGHTSTAFITKASRGLGTAFYAASEQYTDFKHTDERADIFAVGTLLWELFTNLTPPPIPGDAINCGLPKPLSAVYSRATKRVSSERYSSVKELRDQYGTPGGETVFDFSLGRGRDGPKKFLGTWEGIFTNRRLPGLRSSGRTRSDSRGLLGALSRLKRYPE
jgi:serine/threonine protein kinase